MTLTRIPQDELQWVRPDDWPDLPAVLASESKFTGLYKVENHDMNHVAVNFNCPGTTYIVDWGDGNVSAGVLSGASVQHLYDYADADLGAATSEGFKCAVITITPTNPAIHFTAMSLNIKSTAMGSNTSWSSGWLDIRMSTPSITGSAANMGLGGNSSVVHRNCRQFEYVGTHGVTSGTNMFTSWIALESVKVPYSFTSTMTQALTMFSGCTRLRYVPDLDTHAITNFTSMFASCTLLKRVPALNCSAATTLANLFQNCTSLEYIPDIGSIGNCNTTIAMFQGCSSLKAAPAIVSNSSLAITNNMFLNCVLLKTIPVFNTSGLTNPQGMFQGCSTLTIIPAFDFSAVVTGNATNLFASCFSMTKNLSFGLKFTHTLPGQMSSAALDVYYTNLGTASAQTLTVTGNVVSTDTPTIATAKGWTVTGS